jgi:hypothetical protein
VSGWSPTTYGVGPVTTATSRTDNRTGSMPSRRTQAEPRTTVASASGASSQTWTAQGGSMIVKLNTPAFAHGPGQQVVELVDGGSPPRP